MKKLVLIAASVCLANIASAQSEKDFTLSKCQVTKITVHSKVSALSLSEVIASVSCKGFASVDVHSINPFAGQILTSARHSGALLDITYRNFASSFDGTNGLILSITE